MRGNRGHVKDAIDAAMAAKERWANTPWQERAAIFLKAADLEHGEAGKKAVLRKALEANPTSVTLWKAAIELAQATAEISRMEGMG